MTLQTSMRPSFICLRSLLYDTLSRALQTRSISVGRRLFQEAPTLSSVALRTPSPNSPLGLIPQKPVHKTKIRGLLQSLQLTKIQCREPLKTFNASQLALLDPSGARTRLFSKENEDRVNLGDVLLVRFKNGDPFYGVIMSLRRRGPDTGILLRNTVLRVATEMWVKIYNPTVAGIEIVQRAARRARRGRLTYLRKPEHDRGDLSNVLNEYSKTRRTLNAKRTGVKGGERGKRK